MKSYPRKSYFRNRTFAEKKKLDLDASLLQNRLDKINSGSIVLRIDNLGEHEGLVIPSLLPEEFYITPGKSAPHRRALHHTKYLPMTQPKTKREAVRCSKTPLQIREEDFGGLTRKIGTVPETGTEDKISYLGYSFRPVQGRDQRKRLVPFAFLADAAWLFSYANQRTQGIEVDAYKDAQRVRIEGGSVVLGVPSRTQRQPRYRFKLEHVPMVRSNENLASVLGLRPAIAYNEEGEPLNGESLHETYNIRYNYIGDREESNALVFYPHHIAGYFGIIQDAWNQDRNMTPLEMTPFALPSRHQMEFDKRIRNNVLVYDLNVNSKTHLRTPYLAERSLLLGRALAVFGNNDFAYCDPARDKRLRDYASWTWKK